jgi:WW domain-containing oxidoreductase
MDLDLADVRSIERFAADVEDRFRTLDILVCNAGVMALPKRATTVQGIETQFGVNHVGHHLLVKLLLPALRRSPEGRIVVVSSRAHFKGEMRWDDLNSEKEYVPLKAYRQSKLANVLFTTELQRRLQEEKSNVTVNCLHPGVIRSNLFNNMRDGLPWYGRVGLKLATPLVWLLTKSNWYGAQTTLYCCLAPELRGVGGKYFSDCQEAVPSAAARDPRAAMRLWLVTEDLLEQLRGR